MISKFQELQMKQAEENKKELELLKIEYENAEVKLKELSKKYKEVEYQYSIETDTRKDILLKRELRNLEDEIIELNNKIEDMAAKKVELKHTNVDYNIEDIIKDLNKYLKANKVSSYSERLIEAKEEYMKAIETIYLEAKEVHREVQDLKRSISNNYSDDVLEKYNIKFINDLICDNESVECIRIKINDRDLIDNISIALSILKAQKAHYEQKIRYVYETINSI